MDVQRTAFDAVLSGEDVVLLAETGSGKTLAYALPILHRLIEARATAPPDDAAAAAGAEGGEAAAATGQPPRHAAGARRGGRPDDQVLVLVPNRDLCAQVLATFTSLLDALPAAAVAAPPAGVGLPPLRASSLHSEFETDLDADILIATPALALRSWRGPEPIRTVVLDEADALLAGSFKPAARSGYPIEMLIREVKRSAQQEALHSGRRAVPSVRRSPGSGSGREARARLRASKQFVLVGATMPNAGTRNVEVHVRRLFPLAQWHQAPRVHREMSELTQYFVKVDEASRGAALTHALRHGPQGRTLVFANTALEAEAAEEYAVRQAGRGAVGLFHGEVPQWRRAQLLSDFNAGRLSTLVCTGLAARGLDFADVDHVVQYEVATNAVEFMHRVGRSARAGKPGTATTLYPEERADLVEGLRDALAAGDPIDHLFSRKRSLALGIKKRRRRAEAGGAGG